MNTITLTSVFDRWLSRLRDRKGKVAILARIDLAMNGHFGDCKPVGDGVCEMRVHYGPGYRLYYTRRGESVYFLLLGGEKSTQSKDIQKAKALLKELDHDP